MMTRVFWDVENAIQNIICFVDNKKEELDSIWPKVLQIYSEAKRNQWRLFFIGNGGSAAIAIHMTNDFFKNGGMRTQSMHDPAIMTCLANDFGYEYVFSKQIGFFAQKGDVLTAISSSGNSPNVLNAVKVAKSCGCTVVTLSGFKEDNALRQMGDVNVYVPSMEYGVVETVHNMILQQIVDDIVRRDGVGLSG